MLLAKLGKPYGYGSLKFYVGSGIYIDEYLNLYIPDGTQSIDEDTGRPYRIANLYIYYDEDNYNRIYRVGDTYIYYDEDEGDRVYRIGNTYIYYDDDEGGRIYRIGDTYL